jgi:hypothetical protein
MASETSAGAAPDAVPSARHPQEINVRNEKVTLASPDIDDTARRIAEAVAEGKITEDAAEAISIWQAAVAEARVCLVKLLTILEGHDANRQGLFTAALTWAVLDAKLPEPTELRAGWILPEGGSAIPHIWALTRQPAEVIEAARVLWGADHPRAQEVLMSDLGGFPVDNLVDAVVLGQRVTAGRKSAPYPPLASMVMLPPLSEVYVGGAEDVMQPAVKETILKYAPDKGMQLIFENTRYVAAHPRDYLQWGVSTEVRTFLYPLIVNGVFKGDPSKLEYVRIDEEEVARVMEFQARMKKATEAGAAEAASAVGAAGAVSGTPRGSSPAGTESSASEGDQS